jgi:hypothetical protein
MDINILAVRYGRQSLPGQEVKDAVAELQLVIDREGYAWFGKFGQPISATHFKGLEKQSWNYLLLVKKKQHHGYIGSMYKMIGMSNQRPPATHYPPYYGAILKQIKTWIKVEPTDTPVPPIELIVTKSSRNSLLESLRSSYRAHFICEYSMAEI